MAIARLQPTRAAVAVPCSNLFPSGELSRKLAVYAALTSCLTLMVGNKPGGDSCGYFRMPSLSQFDHIIVVPALLKMHVEQGNMDAFQCYLEASSPSHGQELRYHFSPPLFGT